MPDREGFRQLFHSWACSHGCEEDFILGPAHMVAKKTNPGFTNFLQLFTGSSFEIHLYVHFSSCKCSLIPSLPPLFTNTIYTTDVHKYYLSHHCLKIPSLPPLFTDTISTTTVHYHFYHFFCPQNHFYCQCLQIQCLPLLLKNTISPITVQKDHLSTMPINTISTATVHKYHLCRQFY